MLFAVNIIFIPIYGYMACAWAGVAGYGTAMVLSYVVGQRQNPIDYPMQDIFYYVVLTAVSYLSMDYIHDNYNQWLSLGFNTLVIVFFVSIIIRKDFPLSSLPVIGKFFRKN
jgi:peptidoglycan biosynthesis protein MviN/MurJ (putative lipid II flippase)